MPFEFDPTMFRRFTGQIELMQNQAQAVAVLAAEAFAETAERVMRTEFIAAETTTGYLRAKAGGNGPGRVDTERLINAIRSALEVHGSSVVARAGFLEDQEPYFLYQDRGTQTLPAAHAMEVAFNYGREAAIAVILERWK